jgi:hypothetical protein
MLDCLTLMEATRHSRIDSHSLGIFLLLTDSDDELLQLPEHKGYFIFLLNLHLESRLDVS